MTAIQLAFAANILILLPIAIPTLFGIYPTDQCSFGESAGWRMLVGSFWFAILLVSILGIIWPVPLSAVLIIQLIYKSCWLLCYAFPRIIKGRWSEIPPGISISFAMIVVIWPWIIPWSRIFAG